MEEYAWDRIQVDGAGHDHAFVRRGGDTRTTVVTLDDSGVQRQAWVVSGLRDLVVLKSTGSEFKGFLKDRYTTLAETDDRILATSLVARWRYEGTAIDWNKAFDDIRQILLATFAVTYSRALQETLYAMGRAVLEAHSEVAEIRFSAPNKHHFLVDLSPFGLENNGEVFHAADRPYGLIEATVCREGAAPQATPGWPCPASADRPAHDRTGLRQPHPQHPRPLHGARVSPTVESFNALPDDEARARLETCLAVPRWVEDVLAGRPYRDDASLWDRAERAALKLDEAELAAALSRHPRIGERPSAPGHEAAFSRQEQAGVDGSDTELARRLAEGNRAYEERFDRVFLIRAAGRSAHEILGELERRLQNDDATERSETVTQLREIAMLRLRQVV